MFSTLYIGFIQDFDKEDLNAAKKRGLTPLTSFEEGKQCVWFSLWREGKQESDVIIRKTSDKKRVLISYINKDNSLREGGSVNKKELYSKNP